MNSVNQKLYFLDLSFSNGFEYEKIYIFPEQNLKLLEMSTNLNKPL